MYQLHAAPLCYATVLSQKMKKLIDDKYRINLVLDNLPVTAQDLLDEVRPRGHKQHGLRDTASGGAQSCARLTDAWLRENDIIRVHRKVGWVACVCLQLHSAMGHCAGV